VTLVLCYGAGIIRTPDCRVGLLRDHLGLLSYSVYLLQPFVYGAASRDLRKVAYLAPDGSWKVDLTNLSIFAASLSFPQCA
jgi:hypothetical protein